MSRPLPRGSAPRNHSTPDLLMQPALPRHLRSVRGEDSEEPDDTKELNRPQGGLTAGQGPRAMSWYGSPGWWGVIRMVTLRSSRLRKSSRSSGLVPSLGRSPGQPNRLGGVLSAIDRNRTRGPLCVRHEGRSSSASARPDSPPRRSEMPCGPQDEPSRGRHQTRLAAHVPAQLRINSGSSYCSRSMRSYSCPSAWRSTGPSTPRIVARAEASAWVVPEPSSN